MWKLGVVEELISGRDGEVRAAVVQVVARGRQHTRLNRPIQLLYPLEVQSEMINDTNPHQAIETESNDSLPVGDEEQTQPLCPRRAAAKLADKRRREWIATLEQKLLNDSETGHCQ